MKPFKFKVATLLSILIFNLSKFVDHRYVIRYFNLKELSSTNTKAELDSTLADTAALLRLKNIGWQCSNELAKTNTVVVDQWKYPSQKRFRKSTKTIQCYS